MNRKPRTLTTDETARRRKLNGRTLTVIGVAALTFASCGVGASMGASGGTTPAAPTPTVTITESATPGPAQTVEKAPGECLTALDRAETVMADAKDAFDTIAESYQAIAAGDADGFTKATGKLDGHTDTITKDRAAYDAAAQKCRAAK